MQIVEKDTWATTTAEENGADVCITTIPMEDAMPYRVGLDDVGKYNPESLKRIAFAMVSQTLKDAIKWIDNEKKNKKCSFSNPLEYIFDGNPDAPLSFNTCCDILKMNEEKFKRFIQDYMEGKIEVSKVSYVRLVM